MGSEGREGWSYCYLLCSVVDTSSYVAASVFSDILHNESSAVHGERYKSGYITADEPLEQYVTFWQRAHLFKLDPVDSSASDLLQAMHIRGFTTVFVESAIVKFQALELVQNRKSAGTLGSSNRWWQKVVVHVLWKEWQQTNPIDR